MDGKKDVCAKITCTIVKTLESLGFTIYKKKSVLIPTQKIVFFVFFIDLVKGGIPPYMEFTLGSAHAHNFIKFCRKIVF